MVIEPLDCCCLATLSNEPAYKATELRKQKTESGAVFRRQKKSLVILLIFFFQLLEVLVIKEILSQWNNFL